MLAVGAMSSTGEAPFCWVPEVAGQGRRPGEGGRTLGLDQDPSGADCEIVPHRVQREVLGGNWAPPFIYATHINKDLLAV